MHKRFRGLRKFFRAVKRRRGGFETRPYNSISFWVLCITMLKIFLRLRKFCDCVAVVICPSFRRKPESRAGWVVAMDTGFRRYDKKTNIEKNNSLLPSLSHIWFAALPR
jgi:hypothetical protein